MDLTGTKAIVLVLLGMIKLVSGLAPLVFTKIFKRRSERFLKKFIGIVLCFGGGVLLSTVFIHMMKEVRESLERATTMGMIPVEMEFPFAESLICMGFLLILLIESVVHRFFGGHGHSHFPSQDSLAQKMTGVQDIGIYIPEENTASGHDNSSYDEDSPHKLNYSSSVKITQPINTTAAHPDLTIGGTSSPFCTNKKVGGGAYNVSSASLTSYTAYSSDSDSLSHPPSVITTSSKSDMKLQKTEKKMLTSLRSFLMVMALSIHSIFEGMAIGLEETETGVWKLFLAVSIHATAIVFCIGTEMISSNIRKSKIVMYMVVLSIVTPIGVLIGIIVTVHMEQASGEHVLVIGVLQGLAGGTLLYITFFEVLARDKLAKYGMSGLLGALAVMVGFTVMAAMEAGAGGHSHGGHNHGGHAGHVHIHQEQRLQPNSGDVHNHVHQHNEEIINHFETYHDHSQAEQHYGQNEHNHEQSQEEHNHDHSQDIHNHELSQEQEHDHDEHRKEQSQEEHNHEHSKDKHNHDHRHDEHSQDEQNHKHSQAAHNHEHSQDEHNHKPSQDKISDENNHEYNHEQNHEQNKDEHIHEYSQEELNHEHSQEDQTHEYSQDEHDHKHSQDEHNHDHSQKEHNHENIKDEHNHELSQDEHNHEHSQDDHNHDHSQDEHNHDHSQDEDNHDHSKDEQNHEHSQDKLNHEHSQDEHNHEHNQDEHADVEKQNNEHHEIHEDSRVHNDADEHSHEDDIHIDNAEDAEAHEDANDSGSNNILQDESTRQPSPTVAVDHGLGEPEEGDATEDIENEKQPDRDYFAYNVTDAQFLHDSIAYD